MGYKGCMNESLDAHILFNRNRPNTKLSSHILFVFIPIMLNISQRNTAGNVGCSSYFSSVKALAWCSILILWPLNSGDWAPRATELNGTLLSRLKTWTKDHSPPYLLVFLVIGLFSFSFIFLLLFSVCVSQTMFCLIPGSLSGLFSYSIIHFKT